MKLLVVGVNHKTAPIALREQLAFVADELIQALNELKYFTNGCMIVSTCNRSEVYALVDETVSGDFVLPNWVGSPSDPAVVATVPESVSSNLPAMSSVADQALQTMNLGYDTDLLPALVKIKTWLADFRGLSLTEIEPYLYVYTQNHALSHWLRVASGLDSMILGEPQIFGQIKQAVAVAEHAGCAKGSFHWLAQQVFAAAKQVRTNTAVGAQAVSLGFASAKLVTQIFDNPSDCTLLLVAAGEMNRLVAQHIIALGVGRVIICNRSLDRAENLANELREGGREVSVVGLEALPQVLSKADIVSSCSGSMACLIDKPMAKQALKQRRYKPVLMIDLAVPRDIDPKVAELDEVYLYSIDDLQHVIAGNLEQRRQAAVDAELLVSQLVVAIERKFQVRQVGQEIQHYRDQAQQYSQELLNESLEKLRQNPQNPEEILSEFAHALTQRLIHAPSKLLRSAASEGDEFLLNFVVNEIKNAYRK